MKKDKLTFDDINGMVSSAFSIVSHTAKTELYSMKYMLKNLSKKDETGKVIIEIPDWYYYGLLNDIRNIEKSLSMDNFEEWLNESERMDYTIRKRGRQRVEFKMEDFYKDFE